MGNIAILLTVVMLLQLVLTLYQVQYYQRFMTKLVKKYEISKNHRLVSEVVKSKLFSSVVALVYDENKIIVEAYYLNGITIFSTFRSYSQIVGKVLDHHLLTVVIESKEDAKAKAVRSLIEKYA